MKNKNNYITRTFTTKEVQALVIDPETQAIDTITLAMPNKTYKSDEAFERAIQKLIPDKKLVKIVHFEEKEELRCMSITDFLANSQVWVDDDEEDKKSN